MSITIVKPDKEYVKRRNLLIGQATAFANATVGKPVGGGPEKEQAWNITFLARMDDLAQKLGLVPHRKAAKA